MKRLLLIIAILLTPLLNAFSLKDKVTKGNRGDFVVTEQAGTYTVLIIRSVTPHHLLLEEIDVPTLNHNPETISWKEWISQEAPGHTAWISYLIDLDKNQLVESYSHSRNAWLFADDPNHFLARLLTLSLEQTPQHKRKKIGVATGEEDHRALWTPSVVFEGKKIEKSPITAWSARWPHDGSMIADCEIELYFSQFPFPYWIEIKSPHYKASLRTIDTGNSMSSPKPIIFQNSPFFIGGNQWKKDGFELHIHSPKYFSEFRLLAIDTSLEERPFIDIIETGKTSGGEITLHISEKILEAKLQKGHRYRWVLASKEYSSMVIYSDTTFQW
jgi:hypothetical protein